MKKVAPQCAHAEHGIIWLAASCPWDPVALIWT